MSKLKDIAPDIAVHLNDAEIEELIGPKEAHTPTAPTAPTAPTKAQVKEAVRLLRWVGADKVPASAGLTKEERSLGISGIAKRTGLERSYVKTLHAQVQKLK